MFYIISASISMFVWNGASDFVIFTDVKNQFLRGRTVPRLLLTKVDQKRWCPTDTISRGPLR